MRDTHHRGEGANGLSIRSIVVGRGTKRVTSVVQSITSPEIGEPNYVSSAIGKGVTKKGTNNGLLEGWGEAGRNIGNRLGRTTRRADLRQQDDQQRRPSYDFERKMYRRRRV